MSRRHRVTRIVLPATVALTAALVAGCGTTVPLQTRQYVYGGGASSVTGGTSDGLGDAGSGSQVGTPPTDGGVGTLPTDLPTSGAGAGTKRNVSGAPGSGPDLRNVVATGEGS